MAIIDMDLIFIIINYFVCKIIDIFICIAWLIIHLLTSNFSYLQKQC